jgi:cell division protein FtsZ
MFKFAEEETINGAKIKVVGVGGGGGNALNTMIQSDLQGVEFICANTDSQALHNNDCNTVIQLGEGLTSGLGAGANPDIGRSSAIESEAELAEILRGADMVFVTAGMGGGTGTGAAPVIAKIAKDIGALTVGVVTKPFGFEGKRRCRVADEGLKALQDSVDTLITIPNERLLQIAGQGMSVLDAFKKVDEVLLHAVRGISDLITVNGLINLDFADVRTVMIEKGMALMGTGVASGESRAVEAATRAISSPLLENVSMAGATGILMNICGGSELTLFEVNEAAQLIQEEADDDANILFGAVLDPALGDQVRVTVIATGFHQSLKTRTTTVSRPALVRPLHQLNQNSNESTLSPNLVDRSEETAYASKAGTDWGREAYQPEIRTEPKPAVQRATAATDLKQLAQEIGFSGSGQELDSDQYDIPTFLRKHAD